ncbi:MAG: helix-turn-helix transcriptional regulator [Flavobacterium sp.]|nr:helix-turn-helix transcriptional regulator [Flavobacterium sp.]
MHTLLKKARETKGFKTREVANLLQIDQALISKFENGQRTPTRKQVEQLAQLLQINLELLIVAWLKEKIKQVIAEEPLGLKALQEVQSELNPTKENNKVVDLLFEEMEALKAKMEAFRNSQTN